MKTIGAGVIAFVLATSAAVANPSSRAAGLTVTYLGEWRGEGEAALQGPLDLALDGSGNVYVVEQSAERVQVFTSDGRFVRRVGGPRTCFSACRPDQVDGRFFLPNGVAVDSAGNIYVSDLGLGSNGPATGRVQKFSPDGAFTAAFAGVGLDHFSYPRDVAVDASGGIYVADWGKSRVLLLAGSGGAFVREWAAAEFYPWSLAVDEARGSLYVLTNAATNPLVALALEGGPVTRLGQGPARGERIALDREGRLYVTGANAVRVLSPEGAVLGQWGSTGSGPGEFREATGVAVDDQGLVYVADYVGGRVQVFRVQFHR